jgi:hypothetical protein
LLSRHDLMTVEIRPAMHGLDDFKHVFDGITPWSGFVPKGYTADFIGVLTNAKFNVLSDRDPASVGGTHVQTTMPVIGDGENAEAWFEAVNWVVSVREAHHRYVMVTLGAAYGGQAVGACRALQLFNPMPCRLVAVEPVPENYEWMLEHMRTNGIDPTAHWLIQMAVGGVNDPIYFPVGAPGTGANNSYATNHASVRNYYFDTFIREGRTEEALKNLIMNNSTGIKTNLLPGRDALAEVKLMSCLTLRDLVGPFDVVDYLESDIQQSEILVFPPFMDLLRKKVRRIHIGTHGVDIHRELHALFAGGGWEIVFSYEPNASHDSALGPFVLNDGVLTVRNPDL